MLLPEGMPDVMSSPKVLCETYEALTARHRRDLAIVLQLVLPVSAPLHKGWELVRRAHHARMSREQFEPCLRRKSAMVRKLGRIASRGALTCVRHSMGRDETAGRLAIDP